MANPNRLSQVKKGDHCRIAAAAFQAADILLTDPGQRGHLLLRQVLFPTQPGEISSYQSSHVHLRQMALYIL